MFFKEV